MTGSEKALVHTLVLETLAANLGSMLTPIGNPQNLYLYSQYDLSLGVFFRTMAPYTALSLVLLVVLTLVLVPGGAASLSEGKAKTSENQARISEQNADQSEANAKTYAENAKASADEANSRVGQALIYRNISETWAEGSPAIETV